MDIFQQVNLKNKNNDFNNLEEIKKLEKTPKTPKTPKTKEKIDPKNQENDFNYSKLNMISLLISCDKIFNLNIKPFKSYVNYIKEYSETTIIISNHYFNDIFYYKNNSLYLPIENSFILAFIELNFSDFLNKNKINFYDTNITKIPRKNLNYIKNKNIFKEPLNIRNCFLCPYFNFKDQSCTL